MELRKFLSASADDQRRALQESNERLTSEILAAKATAADEKATRLTVEDRLRWESVEKGYLEEELEELRKRADSQALEIRRVQSESQQLGLRRTRNRVLISYGFGIAFFALDAGIAAKLSEFSQQRLSGRHLLAGIRVLGLVLTTLPPYFYLRRTQISKEFLGAVIAALVAVSLFMSGLLSESARPLWADLIGIATLIAVLLTARRRAAD